MIWAHHTNPDALRANPGGLERTTPLTGKEWRKTLPSRRITLNHTRKRKLLTEDQRIWLKKSLVLS